MDFKVAGTTEGHYAIQMDIKIKVSTKTSCAPPLSRQEWADCISSTRWQKQSLLPDSSFPSMLPRLKLYDQSRQDQRSYRQRGKVINKIIEDTGVKIDIDDFGKGLSQAATKKEPKRQEDSARHSQRPRVGDDVEGPINKIMNFGAFVEIAPNKNGMIQSPSSPTESGKVRTWSDSDYVKARIKGFR
jgi:polyribonucleotide nucleotidyltransferase